MEGEEMFSMLLPSRTREDRRSNRRETCAVPITIQEHGRSPVATKITELSGRGCAIEGGSILDGCHAPVRLTLPGAIAAKGEFIWTNGKRTGLKFVQPMAGDTLDFLLRIAANEDDDAADTAASRREKIRLGNAEKPLLRRKKRSGNGELSSMISREVERSSNHRAETRFPIEYATAPSTIEHAGKDLPLIDISSSGLGIDATLSEEIGETLELRFADCAAVEGRIVWKTANSTGIALENGAIRLSDTTES
jgi:hypothetical protein